MAIGSVETERLRLEPWSTRFTPALARINADPEVMRYIGTGEPATQAATEEQSQRFARHWGTYGFGLWAVMPRRTPRGIPLGAPGSSSRTPRRAAGSLPGEPTASVVGFAGLAHPLWLPDEAEQVEVGWRLGREAWGHGYATEAARAALRLAFGALGLRKVVAYIHPDNDRSQRVAARLGMRLERTIPRPQFGFELLVWAVCADQSPSELARAT